MNYAALLNAINTATAQLQGRAAMAVNQSLVLRNWLVGAWILEFEQHGKDRAKYGARLLDTLARDLAKSEMRGFTAAVLRSCRLAYQIYPQIRQTLSVEFAKVLKLPSIRQTLFGELDASLEQSLSPKSGKRNLGDSVTRIPVTLSPESAAFTGPGTNEAPPSIRQTPSAELPTPLSPQALLQLSWSHLVELITIADPWKRAFFENECLQANWSVRQLRRQIGSLLYERTGLSTNKKDVIEKARKQERQQNVADLIRDPYVLEFTGLAERPEYLESDLESALLTHLQSFLLELGAGFCFEARQKRITVGRQHDYIDLVFYHRRLRCHVLIDLKIRLFKHGDAGQMNFYLNWWRANGMEDGDNPPVGIILCSDRDQTAVEFATAGMDQKLFVSRYLVALPSAEKLRAFLEADRARIESLMPPPATRKRAPRKPKS